MPLPEDFSTDQYRSTVVHGVTALNKSGLASELEDASDRKSVLGLLSQLRVGIQK